MLEGVGDVGGGDALAQRALDGRDDEVRRLLPAQVLEHHGRGEDQGGRVRDVAADDVGRDAVGGLENGMARLEVDVAARGHAHAAHLRGEHVGDVVAVEVGRDDDAVLLRMQDGVLQERIAGDAGEQQAAGGQIGAILALGHVIGPVHEGALRVFHDIPVVHQGDAAPVVAQRIVDGAADDALGTLLGHRLHAEGGSLREADLLLLHFLQEELAELDALLGPERPFDTGIHVLGALAEHAQVNPLGILHRRSHAVEIAERTLAGVQVQGLAQHDAQRTHPPPGRRIEGALQAHEILLERSHGLVGEVRAALLEGLLSGRHLQPLDAAVAIVGLLHGGIHHRLGHRHNLLADTVSRDKRDGNVIRDLQSRKRHRNLGHNGYLLTYFNAQTTPPRPRRKGICANIVK